jgi:hypothetical protein
MNLNSRKITCVVLLATMGVSACSVAPDFEAESCRSVDYVRANVEQLDGLEVALCGYLKYEFEDKNLYQSPKAAKQYSDKQCLSLGMREGANVDLPSLSERWVRIDGVVAADFCPKDTICPSACSKIGVFAKDVKPLR